MDWCDRGTCIFFGDGVGAAVLTVMDVVNCLLKGFDMYLDGS